MQIVFQRHIQKRYVPFTPKPVEWFPTTINGRMCFILKAIQYSLIGFFIQVRFPIINNYKITIKSTNYEK